MYEVQNFLIEKGNNAITKLPKAINRNDFKSCHMALLPMYSSKPVMKWREIAPVIGTFLHGLTMHKQVIAAPFLINSMLSIIW